MAARTQPVKHGRAYRQLWRIVDGAVADAFAHHPEYLTAAGRQSARRSINKRVTGAVLGYAVEAAKGRSGASPAAESGLARAKAKLWSWLGLRRPWRWAGRCSRPAQSLAQRRTVTPARRERVA